MILAVPFGLGPFELILILAIVVLVFGVGKMADLGGAMGKSLREFRKAAKEPDDDDEAAPIVSESTATAPQAPAQDASSQPQTAAPVASQPAACSKCGSQLNAGAKFCAECGTAIGAAVS